MKSVILTSAAVLALSSTLPTVALAASPNSNSAAANKTAQEAAAKKAADEAAKKAATEAAAKKAADEAAKKAAEQAAAKKAAEQAAERAAQDAVKKAAEEAAARAAQEEAAKKAADQASKKAAEGAALKAAEKAAADAASQAAKKAAEEAAAKAAEEEAKKAASYVCGGSNVSFGATAAGACSTQADNDFVGGKEGLAVNKLNMFGQTDWQYLAKFNDGGKSEGGQAGLFTVSGLGKSSGSWSVSGDALKTFANFMIVTKAGDAFSAYLFSGGAGEAGTWSTWNAKDLSHMSFYARGTNVTAPVPEPAEWILMLSGLGVVGWIANRRRARTTAA